MTCYVGLDVWTLQRLRFEPDVVAALPTAERTVTSRGSTQP